MEATLPSNLLDREIENIFKPSWLLLAHRNELSENFSFMRFDLGDASIVLFNDFGSIVACDNICPHRGTEFFSDERYGKRPMVCPYHSWSFSRGKVHVPNIEDYDREFSIPPLCRFEVDFCGDFVFVSMAPKSSLREYLGQYFEDLASLSHTVSERLDWNHFDFKASWRIAVENALEPLHLPRIHPDSLNKLSLLRGENSYEKEHSLWVAPIGAEDARKNLARVKRLFRAGDESRGIQDGYFCYFIFPSTMISSTYGFSFSIQTFLPSVGSTTNFVSRFYRGHLRDGVSPNSLRPFFQSAIELNRKVFKEDHEICQKVRRDFGLGHRAHLSSTEQKVAAFQKAWLTRMAATRAF